MGYDFSDQRSPPVLVLCWSFRDREAIDFSEAVLEKRFGGIWILSRGERGSMRGLQIAEDRQSFWARVVSHPSRLPTEIRDGWNPHVEYLSIAREAPSRGV
jgi:hypothetical protein